MKDEIAQAYSNHRDLVTELSEACDGCPGRCCTGRFWSSAELSEHEQTIPLFADVMVKDDAGKHVIPFVEDRCTFLSKLGKCSIYEDRPVACRSYVCHTGGKRSIDIIYDYQAHRKHLSKKGLMPTRAGYTKAFFYIEGDYDSATPHLRDLKGNAGAAVGRYFPHTETYKTVGAFDTDGNFRRA
jgi:Fe-S-cluster containining protein